MTARLRPATAASPTAPATIVGETPLGASSPALILFGIDGGKPRAAWFAAADAEAATAAAAIMSLRALRLADDAGRDLAGQFARGRVLPSGRALVPFAKRDLYARLAALAREELGLAATAGARADPPSAVEAPSAAPPVAVIAPAKEAGAQEARGSQRPPEPAQIPSPVASKPAVPPLTTRPGAHLFVGQPRPGDRAEIGLGSVVLAHEGPEDGWWEAEVIGANGSTFSLRWCDYPTQPTILRKADELALLPPGKP
ncbi:hypothetical protein MBRA_03789 [Methylobacterium brachiatum]|nr:hypothetical protein MBRA_03789 [Methylobacterium brachiatum]